MDFRQHTVETERLRMRPFTTDDLDAYAAMHAPPELVRYLPWEPRDRAASLEALTRHLEPHLDKDDDALTLAGFERVTGRFVGEFVLFLRSTAHRGGEVGYIIDAAMAGRGYATEGAEAMLEIAFAQVGLHRVVGRIDARNDASARVLAKLGMRREAHFVRNACTKGEWTDEAVYALLEDEWRRHHGR